jgi:histidinol-phosphate aminotransferase
MTPSLTIPGPDPLVGPILPRRAVQKITAYAPPLEGRRSRIRLDFNENTVGFPQAAIPGLPEEEARALLTVYPEYDELIRQLSQQFDLPVESLLCTNGSDEAIGIVPATFIEPGEDRALTMRPTFGLIPHHLHLAEADLVEVPYNAQTHLYEPDAIEAELAKKPVKLAIFASPDNPVGASLPVGIIEGWCTRFPGTLFMIDEAYAEYAEQSALSLVKRFPNLLVTRTFSKAWGLAGLRLGVVVGAPELIGYLKRVRSPYSVNTLAVQAALNLLPQKEAVLEAARQTMTRKAKVIAEIEARDYRVIPGSANFFMIDVGPDSAAFCGFFRDQGLLVRDQSARPSLEGLVRVSVGTDTEMARFIDILDALRQRRVLLFDMDGTLVNTRQSFDVTVEQLVSKYTDKPLSSGELDALRREGGFNDDWEATVELLKRRGVVKALEEIATEAQALYLTLATDNEKWIVDPAQLKCLQKRFRLGVATGRYRMEFDTIWKERFSELFEVVICQDDGPKWEKKPEDRILREALSAMGADSGLYVGNSVDDMKAARMAGLFAVGVTFNNSAETMLAAGADWTIDSFDEFIGRLCRLPQSSNLQPEAAIR